MVKIVLEKMIIWFESKTPRQIKSDRKDT